MSRQAFLRTALAAGVLLLRSLEAMACNTPVYQYAMQRWPADDYELLVFHRGALDAESQGVIAAIKGLAATSAAPANLAVTLADVSQPLAGDLQAVKDALADAPLPRAALRMPRGQSGPGAIWTGPLSPDLPAALLRSPARQSLAARLMTTNSIAWVLVECADAARNEEAAAALKAQGIDPLRFRRADPAERFLVSMLVNVEPDLQSYAEQPMAYPVFGRGRALYALIGRGIVADNIQQAEAFMRGPCACEIKAQNPGVDLLLAADWQKALNNLPFQPEELPPLTGAFAEAPQQWGPRPAISAPTGLVAALATQAVPVTQTTAPPPPPPAPAAPPTAKPDALLRTVGIVIVSVLLASAIAGVALMRKRTR